MSEKIVAAVKASAGGTLNWAVITTGDPATVSTMIGSDTAKSADVNTDAQGRLAFKFVVDAFPATAWLLTLTKTGETKPRYQRPGFTDSSGFGHDHGVVTF